MFKITFKYQVAVPKRIAVRYDIRPGDDITWVAVGEVIRVVPADKTSHFHLAPRTSPWCRLDC